MTIEGIFWLIGLAAFIAHIQIAIQTADTARILRRIEKQVSDQAIDQ